MSFVPPIPGSSVPAGESYHVCAVPQPCEALRYAKRCEDLWKHVSQQNLILRTQIAELERQLAEMAVFNVATRD